MVLGFGGQAVLDGAMSVGDLVGFLLLAGFLYEPIGRLHSLNQLVQAGRAAGERVFEILDEPTETESAAAEDETTGDMPVAGDVRFQDVSFSYSDEIPVLHNVKLHARAGETVALVGPTGAGKSTLVHLLTRFYEYDSGEIFIDGQPLRDFRAPVLRRAVGMVTQESFLFNGSVRDNLRLGDPGASDERIWEAFAAANARDFVERLPERLDAVVGERGVKLSVRGEAACVDRAGASQGSADPRSR